VEKLLRNKCIFFSNYSVHILYVLLAVYIQLHTVIILELLLYFQATKRSLTFLTYCLMFKGAHRVHLPSGKLTPWSVCHRPSLNNAVEIFLVLEEQAASVKGDLLDSPSIIQSHIKKYPPVYLSVVIPCHSFSKSLHTVLCTRKFKYEYDSEDLEM
jgi:hypothetical protein